MALEIVGWLTLVLGFLGALGIGFSRSQGTPDLVNSTTGTVIYHGTPGEYRWQLALVLGVSSLITALWTIGIARALNVVGDYTATRLELIVRDMSRTRVPPPPPAR